MLDLVGVRITRNFVSDIYKKVRGWFARPT